MNKTKLILSALLGLITGITVTKTIEKKQVGENEDIVEKASKMNQYYLLLNQWLIVKQSGHYLSEWFTINQYKTIAIYGMRELGERLYDELQGSNIEVKYIIDKNAGEIFVQRPIYRPTEELPRVDIIVVTASFYYQEIEQELRKRVDCNIVSIDEIIYGF